MCFWEIVTGEGLASEIQGKRFKTNDHVIPISVLVFFPLTSARVVLKETRAGKKSKHPDKFGEVRLKLETHTHSCRVM